MVNKKELREKLKSLELDLEIINSLEGKTISTDEANALRADIEVEYVRLITILKPCYGYAHDQQAHTSV